MSVKIDIQGDNLTFSCETSVAKAAQVIAFLSTSEQANSPVEPSQQATNLLVPIEQNKSPREALQESGADTNPQKIAVLGYYLIKMYGNNTFSPAEVRQLFERAGEPSPKNFSRDLKEAVKFGYIFESTSETGKYLITNKGEVSIQNGFSSQGLKKGSHRKTSSKKKGANDNKLIRQEVQNLEVTPNFNDWINFTDLQTKSLKVIWLVAFAEENGIHNLSTSEISFMASKLREDISTRNLHSYTKESIRKGHLGSTGGNKYKIWRAGMDLLHNNGVTTKV